MNTEGSRPPAGPVPTLPAEGGAGSGEGASTALEALIRKRRMAETPDADQPPPQPPALR